VTRHRSRFASRASFDCQALADGTNTQRAERGIERDDLHVTDDTDHLPFNEAGRAKSHSLTHRLARAAELLAKLALTTADWRRPAAVHRINARPAMTGIPRVAKYVPPRSATSREAAQIAAADAGAIRTS